MRVIVIASTAQSGDTVPGYVDHEHPDGYHPYSQDADDLAEQAGRLCYQSWDRPNPATRTNAGYLANIIAQGHFSVLEHASVTFYIDGVTRNFTHELIRHRHLSFSEVSQRYVDASEFPFVVHPGLAEEFAEDALLGTPGFITETKSWYRTLVDRLTGKGMKRKEARQAARHVLPGGTETKILVTGNLRAWRDVLEKRLAPAADAEFREVAKLILAELKKIAPNTFQDFTEEGRVDFRQRWVTGVPVPVDEAELQRLVDGAFGRRAMYFTGEDVSIGVATFEGDAA